MSPASEYVAKNEKIRFYKEENFKVVETDGSTMEVPEEWMAVRLGDIINSMYYGITAKAVEGPKDYRLLRTTDIINYSVNWDNVPYCEITENRKDLEKYFIKKDDIIVARAGTVGVSILADRDFSDVLFGSYLIKIRLSEEVYPKYIHYFFQSKMYWNHLNSAQGSTLKNINLPLLKSLVIPLPPLPEQRRIAEVLSSLDEAIEAVDEGIRQAERIKKGLIQKLLTRGIRHDRFKDTEIGRIPEEWEVVRLGEIVEVYDKNRIPLSEAERRNRKGPYPYCGANGIIDFIDDYIFDGKFVLLAEDGGSYGKYENSAYIMSGKFWVNNHAHILKAIDGKSLNAFIMYSLNFMDLNPHIVGSTRKKLNQEKMLQIKLPLPPLSEQQEIAKILSKWDEVIDLKRAKKERLEKIKKKVMDTLLTGKVRVMEGA